MEDKIDRLFRLTICIAITYFSLHILFYLYRFFIEGG